jgi:hypothetical protein
MEGTCLSLSSFSPTRLLIWITNPNIIAASRNVGPIVPTAENVSILGCANSVNPTFQEMLGSDNGNGLLANDPAIVK